MAQKEKIGSVMVIGAGIGGMQASLDLAESGFLVYLVDSSPVIGGMMAQLDKTFPTNDCAMCIMSPKLVEVGRHINVRTITNAQLEEVRGEAGNFEVTLLQKARYIEPLRCTGCGVCAQHCPVRVIDEFNQGLNKRAATYIPYPQAVPLVYAIDHESCIGCGLCEKVCLAKAIKYSDVDEKKKINVGAIILAIGSEVFDPKIFDTYNYANFTNVLTSLEFERILSASGPYRAHLLRPSDREVPKSIAWIQCVGSRNINKVDQGYCSSVCCTYAIKQAIIAKEHSSEPLDTAIFFMDMRTYGKDFDKYYNRAKKEGIRFIRSRVHTVEPVKDNGSLKIRYATEDGNINEEIFDMVVLSVGLKSPSIAKEMAEKLGIELNKYNFAFTKSFSPVKTTKPGIYVCGTFQGPKDIPETVMEASAASNAAQTLLAESRHSLVKEKEYPPERDVSGEEPRIGVFVCHCGINIGGVVNVPEVRDYAEKLPNVVIADRNLFTCSQDTQEKIKNIVKEYRLNRVVVASCSPRTHEPLYQETIKEAGLNRYLFNMANIRDQCSWVHMYEPQKATEKAKVLVQMAVAKAALQEPLEEIKVGIIPSGLVIGGGIAGMEAALGLADQGFKVHLIEKGDRLGGQALNLRKTWKGEDIKGYLNTLVKRVSEHELIDVYISSEVKDVTGFVGNFKTTVSYNGENKDIEHGIAIIATGAHPLRPDEYLYGKNENVLCWPELDKKIEEDRDYIKNAKCAVFIQCVGSRDEKRPYCSKVCCTHAISNALDLKEINPDMDIYILYRDIRTYGEREDLYKEARKRGIIFIRYDLDNKPKVEEFGGRLKIEVKDHVLGMPIDIYPDFISLQTAIIPNDIEDLAKLFKISLNEEKFLLEAHMKLRPVDFSTDGIFLCGMAHSPKDISESIKQARAAASRASDILTKENVHVEPIVSVVDQEKCSGCGICERVCPYDAIHLVDINGFKKAQSTPASCKGCGVCSASCPSKAVDMRHFGHNQIRAQIQALAV